ncbi:MAG: transcriptional repressor LexA [Candidatus Eisenbacteria bacterium]|jgi:repressor LexA|nr:transcriptional repressor LexA [Candidatus Eisenbacteria bacterium]
MSDPKLFPRQRAILREIARFTNERGFPPTLRELAMVLNVRSANGIRQQILALERKGYLRRDARKPRSIALTSPEEERTIPVLGLVAAGSPIDVSEGDHGRLELGPSLGITNPRCFAVQVEGESMIGEHIVQGDYVVLDPGVEPRNGHVVAVSVDGAVTLKTYHPVTGGVELVPANPRMKAIQIRTGAVHDAHVLGVAVALVRRMGTA